ncbi:MAG: uroporphyrinogen-III synthase [Pseudomonadota bacterium]
MTGTRPILAIRPEPGLSATLAMGRGMGLDMRGFALSHVKPVAWELPPPDRFDALLIGSANAMRMSGENLAKLTHLPVHAVGEATAQEARAAGFDVTRQGKGGLQTVIDAVTPPIRYLRLVGNEFVDLSLPQGVSFEPVQVYAVEPCPFDATAAKWLGEEPIVLLHSAAMTRQFIAECDRLAVDRSRISLAAMGPRIAEPAQAEGAGGWRAIHISQEPSDEALLALARELCL